MFSLTQKFVAVEQIVQFQYHPFSVKFQVAICDLHVVLFVFPFVQFVIVHVRERDAGCVIQVVLILENDRSRQWRLI